MHKSTLLLAGALLLPSSLALSEEVNPERLFKSKCASCHGADGKGATTQGKKMHIGDMTSAAWKKEFSGDKIKDTVEKGFTREKDGVKQEMKPVKLSPEQLAAVVKYVEGLK